MGAARHTPTEEHAPKHALILLAASPPCQLNGWASDSSLYIPTVPSRVKPCSTAAYMVITAPTATILNTENASERGRQTEHEYNNKHKHNVLICDMKSNGQIMCHQAIKCNLKCDDLNET